MEKRYSYQDPGGVTYQSFRVKRKYPLQKEFTSPGLRLAARLERGKRNIQKKVEDTFGVGKVIDPKTGQPVVQDARKRKLEAEGVKPTLPKVSEDKPTEIGKDGTIDFLGIGRRAVRKAKPLIGKGINAAIDVADSVAYPMVGAVTTPGRTLSKGIKKTIENPVAAATYGASYAAPFIGGVVGKSIMVADNLVPNPLQYKAINSLTPRPVRNYLGKKAEQFDQGVGRQMKSFQWTDVPGKVQKLIYSPTKKQ